MAKIFIKINIFIFVSFSLLNLIGVFMPELGFDALWYHLTLPKLWLLKEQWYFPGGLLYYSAMPRLMETIFIPLVKYTGTIGPKLTQYIAGIITAALIYQITYKLTQKKLWSWFAANLFYATWLVSWQSSSAYVDLSRTMFESLALYFLVINKKILPAGIFLGLAISTKLQALGSLLIYSLVFSPALLGISLFVAFPWFAIAYHFTSNPFYPLFEGFMIKTQLSQVPTTLRVLLVPYDDILSPVIGLLVMFTLLALFSPKVRKIAAIGILGMIYYLLTPPPSTRYFLPYLPALIISSVYILSRIKDPKIIYISLTLSSLFILGLRLYSYKKFMPFILHQQTTNQFLASQSYRLPDTFIDSDNYILDNLPSNSKIIIDKLHNLYYFPHNFDHTSWSKSTNYDSLITKDQDPSQISGQLLHTNSVGIQVFKLTKLVYIGN